MHTTTKHIVALIVMLSLSVFSGCEATTQRTPYQTMDLAQPVDILNTVVGGHPSLTQPDLKLITSQAQLQALGAGDIIGRDVNFNNESIVLATLGEMPTSGYWINITTVYQEGDTLQIYGQANRPSADAMAGQVLTYPYCAVVIPNTGATMLGDQIQSVQNQDPPM